MKNGAKAIVLIQGLLMIAVVASPFFDGAISNFYWLPQNLSQAIGSLMAIAGILINVSAIRALGKSFTISAVPKATGQFVANGIFRYTRNPMYFGGILMSFGWALSLHSLLTFCAAILLAITLYCKILIEERELRLRFGASYEAYLASVKRLVPFLF